jgi:DNA-binding winged helix-turn-helix (wHTH) protein/Tfp pilus assembly protein PilF
MAAEALRSVYRFGVFELDARAGELRKRGILVKLHGQSVQVLTVLLERPGEVVTREELRVRLWPAGTNVDSEHSLANAIKKIRDVLGDSADTPRFIETIPRRGYRFLPPVRNAELAADAPDSPPPAAPVEALPPGFRTGHRVRLIALSTAVVFAGTFLVLSFRNRVNPDLPRYSDPEAYNSYRRARSGPRLTRDSIAYFTAAIAKKPRFALAHAGLSSTYISLALHAEVSPREVMPRARQTAIDALAIDNSVAEAHLDLGVVKATFDWDRPGAEREFRRALQLEPELDGVRPALALLLANGGRFDEAMDQIAAFEKGPVGLQSVYANVLYFSRQYQRTVEYCRWALSFAPGAEALQFWLGRAYADQGRLGEAIELIERSRATDRNKPVGFGILTGLYARAGRRADAQKLLATMLQIAEAGYISPVSVAIAYAGLGEVDEAFTWLDKACFEHDFSLSSLKVDPLYDPLRRDPRFQALLHRVNLG